MERITHIIIITIIIIILFPLHFYSLSFFFFWALALERIGDRGESIFSEHSIETGAFPTRRSGVRASSSHGKRRRRLAALGSFFFRPILFFTLSFSRQGEGGGHGTIAPLPGLNAACERADSLLLFNSSHLLSWAGGKREAGWMGVGFRLGVFFSWVGISNGQDQGRTPLSHSHGLSLCPPARAQPGLGSHLRIETRLADTKGERKREKTAPRP